MKFDAIAVIGSVLILCSIGSAQAATPDITQAVSQDCRWDYHNFCSEYGIGSLLLNYCFRKTAPSCPRLA